MIERNFPKTVIVQKCQVCGKRANPGTRDGKWCISYPNLVYLDESGSPHQLCPNCYSKRQEEGPKWQQ